MDIKRSRREEIVLEIGSVKNEIELMKRKGRIKGMNL